ncbi:MAG: DNA-binding protein [Sulfuricella sp.]|nr:DNA-binding protein [Sulfuricella sp.]
MEKRIKTRKEAKEELFRKGISVTQWANENGFKPGQVRDVLRKNTPCRFGYSHKIAVLLGIKNGEIE